MKRGLLAVALVVLVAAVLYVRWRPLVSSTATPPPKDSPSIERAVEPAAPVRAGAATAPADGAASSDASADTARRGDVGGQRADVEPDRTAAVSGDPPVAVEDAASDEPDDTRFPAAYLGLAERFRAEPRDPPKAAALERAILDHLSRQTGLEVTSVTVECRRTLCRLKLVQPERVEAGDVGTFEGFGTAIGLSSVAADGSLVTELLLGPDPEPQP